MRRNLTWFIGVYLVFTMFSALAFAKANEHKPINRKLVAVYPHLHPLEIKADWKDLGVNIEGLETVANKYFEQPYRFNYDAPEMSSNKIADVYFQVFNSHLPEIVVSQMKQALTDYQNGEGKQSGFTNDSGLATVLPKKKILVQDISNQAGL